MGLIVPTNAYCTLDDVKALLPHRQFDGNSKPTILQAEGHIQTAAKLINGTLQSLGWTTPLSGASAVAFLAVYNSFGAVRLCELSSFSGVADNLPEHIAAFGQQFDDFLKDLRKGAVKIPGVDQPEEVTGDINEDMVSGEGEGAPTFSVEDEF